MPGRFRRRWRGFDDASVVRAFDVLTREHIAAMDEIAKRLNEARAANEDLIRRLHELESQFDEAVKTTEMLTRDLMSDPLGTLGKDVVQERLRQHAEEDYRLNEILSQYEQFARQVRRTHGEYLAEMAQVYRRWVGVAATLRQQVEQLPKSPRNPQTGHARAESAGDNA